MAENIYERIHQQLSWKRVIGFNVVLFVLLIVPLSVRLAQQDTENRSGAAGEVGVPEVTPPPDYPVAPPKIDRVSMFFGKKGDTVVVFGSNFGAYQWGSKVFLGNVEAPVDSIVRWSNNVLEVKIPETARTGKVWVVVNSQKADWEGSLLLYDISRAAQLGLRRDGPKDITLLASKASGATSGMIEFGYVSEPFVVTPLGGVSIESQSQDVDSLGKKLRITFNIGSTIAATDAPLLSINYPGIGSVEIVRAELYDSARNLIQIYSDPLSVKLLP